MASISLTLSASMTGQDQLKAKLQSMAGQGASMAASAVGVAAKRIEGSAKRLAPVSSGQLRNSISSSVQASASGATGQVSTNVDYAVYVEFGTGPKGRASTNGAADGQSVSYRPNGWYYPVGDGTMRYTEGMPARPYMYPAAQENQSALADALAEAVKKWK